MRAEITEVTITLYYKSIFLRPFPCKRTDWMMTRNPVMKYNLGSRKPYIRPQRWWNCIPFLSIKYNEKLAWFGSGRFSTDIPGTSSSYTNSDEAISILLTWVIPEKLRFIVPEICPLVMFQQSLYTVQRTGFNNNSFAWSVNWYATGWYGWELTSHQYIHTYVLVYPLSA